MSLNRLTRLFEAAENGVYEIVESELNAGYEPDTKWDWTMGGKYFGKTIRDVALKANQKDIVKLIDSYSDDDAQHEDQEEQEEQQQQQPKLFYSERI